MHHSGMVEVPEFALYGEGLIEEKIQSRLKLRDWCELTQAEKETIVRVLVNERWIHPRSTEVLSTIVELNRTFLRLCPGERVHKTPPSTPSKIGYRAEEDTRRLAAAWEDFVDILVGEESNDLILRALSIFARNHIDQFDIRRAKEVSNEEKRRQHVANAFRIFDRLSRTLNHIFGQFSVNVFVTRGGFIPRQDDKIEAEIYEPTLKVLSHPKWQTVSDDLSRMFDDYRQQNYAEAITKAHSAVQRFFQVLVGEEGKSGKGELGKLFAEAKKRGVVSGDRFTDSIISTFQGFIASERATNSTAKPASGTATASDALLVMNVVMVLLQHCLLRTNELGA